MNTFMPYLEAFTHLDDWSDEIENTAIFEEAIDNKADAGISSPADIEDKAYAYEIEMVLDEEDDFFIG